MWQYNYVRGLDELYHHGILGQKWGKKNGPPYPLGTSDHSASEQKAGWRKSLDTASKVAKAGKSIVKSTQKINKDGKTKEDSERKYEQRKRLGVTTDGYDYERIKKANKDGRTSVAGIVSTSKKSYPSWVITDGHDKESRKMVENTTLDTESIEKKTKASVKKMLSKNTAGKVVLAAVAVGEAFVNSNPIERNTDGGNI